MSTEQVIFDPDYAIMSDMDDWVILELKVKGAEPNKYIEANRVASFEDESKAIDYCKVNRGRRL